MISVLCFLWGGVLLGWFFRRFGTFRVSGLLSVSICLMLFFVGLEVGCNRILMQSLGRLGWEALAGALLSALGCGFVSLVFWKVCREPATTDVKEGNKSSREGIRLLAILSRFKDSAFILLCFVVGVIAGVFQFQVYFPVNASFYCLGVLLVLVGFSVGQNRELLGSMRKTKKKLLLLPLVTIVGTYVAMLITFFLCSRHGLFDWLSVGSGFGYYSLSSILITEAKGAELGTIALMYNVFREIFAILFAPLLVKVFGPLSVISVGGATTADTTLPSIARESGPEFVPLAIYHGIAVDFTVPFLVPFFCML